MCAFVHGFEPYFYTEIPSPTFSPDDCVALAEVLNVGDSSRSRSFVPLFFLYAHSQKNPEKKNADKTSGTGSQ